jgi:hypothetical protein
VVVCLSAWAVDGRVVDMQERLTAKEAMAHAYFAPVRQHEAAVQ